MVNNFFLGLKSSAETPRVGDDYLIAVLSLPPMPPCLFGYTCVHTFPFHQSSYSINTPLSHAVRTLGYLPIPLHCPSILLHICNES